MKQSFEPAYITPTGALISEHDYNFLPDSYKFQCTVYRSEQASEESQDELWNDLFNSLNYGFAGRHELIIILKSKFEIRRKQQ